ncbi:uncharacterized protein LOC110247291 [Exaiptasia diaphana]|uniref:Uncharacterized protein n=1 Tax=Exaiptasia diaphana TaxID=2652724 RepID=A0A913YS60_EXADI|nr:uncharacterized protein LOC110247291 [Exaiptasia diaphana]
MFNISENDQSNLKQISTLLHENLYLLNIKCFFRPSRCCHSNEENRKNVLTKQRMLGSHGNQFPCYYDPYNSSQVFYYRHYFELIIVSSIALPTLGIIIGVYILIRVSWKEEQEQVRSAFGSLQRSPPGKPWWHVIQHNPLRVE